MSTKLDRYIHGFLERLKSHKSFAEYKPTRKNYFFYLLIERWYMNLILIILFELTLCYVVYHFSNCSLMIICPILLVLGTLFIGTLGLNFPVFPKNKGVIIGISLLYLLICILTYQSGNSLPTVILLYVIVIKVFSDYNKKIIESGNKSHILYMLHRRDKAYNLRLENTLFFVGFITSMQHVQNSPTSLCLNYIHFRLLHWFLFFAGYTILTGVPFITRC